MAIFRRVGIKARWCFAVSVCGSWLCFGRLDPKKIQKLFSGAFGLVFLPLAPYLILGTVLKSARQQPEFGLSGFAFNAKSKSVEFFAVPRL